MTTVCVVRKGGQVTIAADSLVTFGDTRLPHGYEDNDKLFKVGDSYFGMSGTTAHFPVLRKALAALPKGELRLSVTAIGDPSVAMWSAALEAPIVQSAFGRRLELAVAG